MTKVTVTAGICGFTVLITAEKHKDRKIYVTLDTECKMIRRMSSDISPIEIRSALAGQKNNPVYMSAAKHIKHIACPVISGILKAIEVEAGLALPKDAHIVFPKD